MLFFPINGKPLREIYAELSEEESFKDLELAEDRFVWLIACRGSFLVDSDSPDFIADQPLRMQKAVELITRSGIPIPDHMKSRWMNGQMDPRVRAAVEVIKKFIPEARERGAEAVDSAFNNLIKLTKVDIEEYITKVDEDGNKVLDTSAMNSYASAMDKIVDVLPKIIKMKEQNMGVAYAISAELLSGRSANKIFMERNKRKSNA